MENSIGREAKRAFLLPKARTNFNFSQIFFLKKDSLSHLLSQEEDSRGINFKFECIYWYLALWAVCSRRRKSFPCFGGTSKFNFKVFFLICNINKIWNKVFIIFLCVFRIAIFFVFSWDRIRKEFFFRYFLNLSQKLKASCQLFLLLFWTQFQLLWLILDLQESYFFKPFHFCSC